MHVTRMHQPEPLIHKNDFSNENMDTMAPETSENFLALTFKHGNLLYQNSPGKKLMLHVLKDSFYLTNLI